MQSESPDRLAWPCSQLEDLAQMISVSQIVRLYRRSDRPNTGKEGHNPAIKAKNAKKDRRAILCWPWFSLQGGKTFCASFCASLIAGSRRAFLCVDCVCLFGVLSKMHEVRTFAPCKAFLFDMFAFFSSLENYFGFRTTNVKGKTDHSVSLRWNKRFWTFLKRRVFFWLCIRLIYELISPVEFKPACILLLVVTVTFFTCPDF